MGLASRNVIISRTVVTRTQLSAIMELASRDVIISRTVVKGSIEPRESESLNEWH